HMTNCPANGCYNGYWCNTTTMRCQAPPSQAMCPGAFDAGTPPAPMPSNAISIVVEPSDHANALLSAINGARTSVHMTMYILSDDRFVTALIDRKNAGIDVKVVLNQAFPNNANTNGSAF